MCIYIYIFINTAYTSCAHKGTKKKNAEITTKEHGLSKTSLRLNSFLFTPAPKTSLNSDELDVLRMANRILRERLVTYHLLPNIIFFTLLNAVQVSVPLALRFKNSAPSPHRIFIH